MAHLPETDRQHVSLPDGATVIVVGGGPAGAFFAIRILRKARELGKKLEVLIIEKKREIHSSQLALLPDFWERYNYCAGSISPRMADVLLENGLTLPDETVEGTAAAVTVHGDWKSIELPIPEGRNMLSVFRSSRPGQRPGRAANFDSYLLNRAIDAGAKVITANVRDVRIHQEADRWSATRRRRMWEVETRRSRSISWCWQGASIRRPEWMWKRIASFSPFSECSPGSGPLGSAKRSSARCRRGKKCCRT